eukprot:gene1868-biopygen1396
MAPHPYAPIRRWADLLHRVPVRVRVRGPPDPHVTLHCLEARQHERHPVPLSRKRETAGRRSPFETQRRRQRPRRAGEQHGVEAAPIGTGVRTAATGRIRQHLIMLVHDECRGPMDGTVAAQSAAAAPRVWM